jgi:hypothetical protein
MYFSCRQNNGEQTIWFVLLSSYESCMHLVLLCYLNFNEMLSATRVMTTGAIPLRARLGARAGYHGAARTGGAIPCTGPSRGTPTLENIFCVTIIFRATIVCPI